MIWALGHGSRSILPGRVCAPVSSSSRAGRRSRRSPQKSVGATPPSRVRARASQAPRHSAAVPPSRRGVAPACSIRSARDRHSSPAARSTARRTAGLSKGGLSQSHTQRRTEGARAALRAPPPRCGTGVVIRSPTYPSGRASGRRRGFATGQHMPLVRRKQILRPCAGPRGAILRSSS